ncbi:phage tail protein [Halobium salinum]|uniref:Phage tail protein n=1 Tax=Halobium salinum TaxID=1364940 RepID=A0ABD5PIX7_9EURY|nr:phage tail protein [Halobium salinum]
MSMPGPDPYLSFRFHVEIDALTVGGFSSVSGLEHEMTPEEYEEGGNNRFTHKLPTRYTQPNVVLERGLIDSPVLWEWLANAREGKIERRTVLIVLLNTVREETWRWELTGAYPIRWAGPDLQADQAAVAIETVELAHQGFTSLG